MELPSGETSAQWRSSPKGQRLVDYTAERLAALCRSAGFADEREKIVATYRGLLKPWGHLPLGKPSGWVSDVSDDHTPVELSVAIEDQRAEVRALFEPQGDVPTLRAFRTRGLRFHERLEREHQVDLTRFRVLEDLFLPETMTGSFAVWTSVGFAPGAAPTFTTYFNPQARGLRQAPAIVEEALHRLGMLRAMSYLRETVLRRGPELDELAYFTLDLTPTRHARVNVYARHHEATPRQLESACSAARSHVPGEAFELACELAGADTLAVRAPVTCSAFTAEHHDQRPASTALYIPVCAYARDDAAVHARIRDYLLRKAIDPGLYDSLIGGFANRPLDAGAGMQSWFGLRRHQGKARFIVHLATEAHRIHAPGSVPAPSERPVVL